MSKELFFQSRELEIASLTRNQLAQLKQKQEETIYESKASNNKGVQETQRYRPNLRREERIY
jgi:hypothetical protein